MPTRLALGDAVALIAATGLQEPIPRDPFGVAAIAQDYNPIVAEWRDVRTQLSANDEGVSASLVRTMVTCHSFGR